MAALTYFVALPFTETDDGELQACEGVECTSALNAVTRAEILSRASGHVGAVAFSREGDPMLGEFANATIIKTFGNVPGDLFPHN